MPKITYRKSDGRYQSYVYVTDAKGNRKRKYVYGDTEHECDMKLTELKYEVQNNLYVQGSKTPLEKYLEEYHKLYVSDNAVTTKDLYQMYIDKHINPYIGKTKLCDLNSFALQQWVVDLQNESNLSGNSIRKVFSFMNSALKAAVKNDYLKKNPCEAVKIPKKKKYKPNVCTEKLFNQLLEIVTGTFDEVAVILAGVCGLRRGEICGLKWKDIDFDNNSISINETFVRYSKNITKEPKTDSSKRTLYVPGFVIDVLKKYRSTLKVVPEKICPYKPQSYSDHFKKLRKKNNLPYFRFHDLRHFNAILMLKYGVPDKVAAKRLGHSQVSTTREIYQHVLEDMDQEAVNVIGNVFNKDKKETS